MLELLFIRHGQTDWNLQQKVMGAQPIPLNETGRAQAAKLAEYLKDVKLDAVAASPVLRAVETARILLRDRPHLKLIEDQRFAEIEYGDWLNLNFKDLSANYPDTWRDYHHDPENVIIPKGERLPVVRDRTAAAVNDLVKKYPDGRIAIVSHADVIKLAVIGVLKWPMKMFGSFSMDNCATVLVRNRPQLGLKLVWFNHMNGFEKDIKATA